MILDKPTQELSVLSYIDQNSDATQRELSEHIGVSLGSINILVKRLAKKGLIKMVRLPLFVIFAQKGESGQRKSLKMFPFMRIIMSL